METTTFGDFDDFMNLAAEDYARIGTKAVLTQTFNEMPGNVGDVPVRRSVSH